MAPKRSGSKASGVGKKAKATASRPLVELSQEPLAYIQKHPAAATTTSAAGAATTGADAPASTSTGAADGQQQVLQANIQDRPFRHVICSQFLTEDFAAALRDELLNEEFLEKHNDLYTFRQTRDLKTSEQPHIATLRRTLYSPEFLGLMKSLTGIQLNDTVDMASIRFSQTENLLCHDDELEGRRVAYILYLVPKTWTAKDGGTLDLFGADEHLQPTEVVTRLVPAWNTFTFFDVSTVSFHQVAEILTPDKERLSISGWFHGEPIVRPPPYIEPPLLTYTAPYTAPESLGWAAAELQDRETALLGKWINPKYLLRRTQQQIADRFSDDSSIELPDFLRDERFEEILKVLSVQQGWQRQGPPHRRLYERLPPLAADEATRLLTEGAQGSIETPDGAVEGNPVAELRMLLQSQAFAAFLQRVTRLELTDCTGEARRFQVGHYTLLHDSAHEPAALDVVLSCSPEWDESWGGFVSYVVEGEEEELLTVWPHANRLSLVYRTPGSARFVKYVNCLANIPRYDFACVYREAERDSSDDDDNDNEDGDNADQDGADESEGEGEGEGSEGSEGEAEGSESD